MVKQNICVVNTNLEFNISFKKAIKDLRFVAVVLSLL